MPALDPGDVDALVGSSRSLAAVTEDLRCLPPETIAAAEAAGVFELVTPPEFGGRAGTLSELAQLARRLAHGCPSTAWTLSFLAMHNWLLSKFPHAAQEELWRDRAHVLAPAPLAPGGSAVIGDDGIRVTGEWAWGTGVMHADWVLVHVLVDPAVLDLRFAVLPIDEVHVRDVWHTSGMRGTGSNTVEVDDVFVPAHRTVSTTDFMAARPADLDPRYPLGGYPVVPVLCLVAAAPALGAAERCLDLVGAQLGERVLAYTLGERQADQPAALVRLAEATARIRAARAQWEAELARLDQVMAAGAEPTLRDRAGWRLAATATVHAAREAIDDLLVGAGGSVYFEDQPLQRYQRDVNTLKGHAIFDRDRTMELVGRVELGLDPGPTPML